MIGRLSGRVVEEAADGAVVLDVHGVGYEVALPIGSLGRMLAATSASAGPRPSVGAEVTVFVHTHVREDALALFGFATREDRAAFRALIGVSSIGPKIAMAVLGALPGPELSVTVGRGDVAKLTKIPGIGKRTAERIVLELKDKLPAVAGAALPGAAVAAAAARGGQAELLAARARRHGVPAPGGRARDGGAGRQDRDDAASGSGPASARSPGSMSMSGALDVLPSLARVRPSRTRNVQILRTKSTRALGPAYAPHASGSGHGPARGHGVVRRARFRRQTREEAR